MFNDIALILKILFAKDETPSRQPLVFEWWLIRRRGRPFLLLPTSPDEAHVALELYSAQRSYAKILRALLPLILKTPLARLFPRVRIEVDATSELAQFLAQQSGVPAARLRPPAIKVDGLRLQKARLVMLLCDEAKRPVTVVKVGLNPRGWLGLHPYGWKTTEQEADQLENLPAHIIGCIRLTGRISTPSLTAFATTYFSGDSPRDDEGMDHLFHSWLNPVAPMPIKNMRSWQELETAFAPIDPQMWAILNAAVAEKKVHSTLHHGDFTPWNIRATSGQNLQVFDWKNGQAQGIPAWDWFHFFVQTAVLAKRYPERKVAVEIEQLLQSPRFRIYAAAARITPIVKPLFLAYLLHQKHVVQPLDGRQTVERLYGLLAARWGLKPVVAAELKPAPAEKDSPPTFLASIRTQLKFALSQVGDLIWEPTISSVSQPTMRAQFRVHWQWILMSVLILGAVTGLQFSLNAKLHLTFIPFQLIPCILLAVKLDRRWAALMATVAAILAPMLRHIFNPDYLPLDVMVWNTIMRVILFQIVVLLAWCISHEKTSFRAKKSLNATHLVKTFASHWATVLMACLFLMGVAFLDVFTSPQMNLLPMYLLPCVVLTLVLDFRWGTVAAVIAAAIGPLMQRFEDTSFQHLSVEAWNTFMHFLVFQSVVIVLEHIRRGSILLSSPAPDDGNLQLAIAEQRRAKMVFVVGVWRSGTSLLHAMMNQHPKIALLYEAELFGLYDPLGDQTLPSDWTARVEYFNQAISRHRLDAAALSQITTGRECMQAMASAWAARKKTTIMGDKSVACHMKLPELAQIFPEAEFIILWRNPLDSCRSTVNAGRGNSFFGSKGILTRTLFGAKQMAEGVLKLRAEGRRVHEVVYEELIVNPEDELKKICQFVGLEFDPQMLALASADYSMLPPGEHHQSVRSGVVKKIKKRTEVLSAGFVAKGQRYAALWRQRYSTLAFIRALPPEADVSLPGIPEKIIDGLVYSGWLRLAEFKHHIIRLMPMNVWRRWRQDPAIPAETGTVISPEKAA